MKSNHPVALLWRALVRGPDEIAVRVRQQAHILGERAHLALSRIIPHWNGTGRAIEAWHGPRGGALVDHFRNRETPRFFPGLYDREAAVAEMRARWPEAEHPTIAAADRMLAGSFDLLGHSELGFGSPPDWHLDPLLRVRAPASLHWSRINYLDPLLTGDHKVIWELNRHHYLVTLGQAYWYTGNERYATSFVQHLTSWMDQNPARLGINWASSLEVSFRAVSWLWALHFFRSSPAITELFLARVLHVLQLHARHIERYLSTYFSPNTHLTGEALGLFYLGTLLPEFRNAARWQRKALAIFATEIPRQVLPDGVYFEQSTWYHKYTVDFLTHLLLLARENGVEFDSRHAETLEHMLEHVVALTRPDGTVPLIGDDDGGCLMPLDGSPSCDFRAALATGAALFGRGDFKYVAGRPARETFWLLGATGLQRYDRLAAGQPAFDSAAFADSGCYVMRDGWQFDANYMLVDGGPHGSLTGGHAHADALAVVVSRGAENLLVDSGTGTYTTDPAIRNAFRSSLAHNTVSVDGHSSSVPGGPFGWASTAATTVDRWISTRRFDFFRGRHDGFSRPARPVVHERTILFVKHAYWIMRDRVAGAASCAVESRFHFAPHLSVEHADGGNGMVVASAGSASPLMRLHVVGASEDPLVEPCSISDVYGSFRPATRAAFSLTDDAEAELITLLLPGPDAVTAQIQPQGGGLTIQYGEFLDCIIIGGSETQVSTNFAWVWLRRCAQTGQLRDYILIDGSFLFLDGTAIVQRDSHVSHLCMAEGTGT